MRQRVVPCYVTLLVASLCFQGCIRRINHNPASAAATAQSFVDAAFVRGQVGAAFEMLSPEVRQDLGPEGFARALAQEKGASNPTRVSAEAYEPLPGQPAMTILLVGEGPLGPRYYRVVMRGDAGRGYKVDTFEHAPRPFLVGAGRRNIPRSAGSR
jgi:hypothetical protein